MRVHFSNRAELTAALAAGAFAGRAMHVMILHNNACTPEHCSCAPEFVVEDLTPENYVAGQSAQANWERASRS